MDISSDKSEMDFPSLRRVLKETPKENFIGRIKVNNKIKTLDFFKSFSQKTKINSPTKNFINYYF